MLKRFIYGICLLIVLTSPVWFFVLKNEVTAFKLMGQLRNASLPDGTKILSSSRRVFNSGNGDGCDYQAIALVEHFDQPSTLHSSYMDLFETIFNEELRIVDTNSSAEWFAKLSSQPSEFSIKPDMDDPHLYTISATLAPRKVSPDFRCW
ncbi:MAG: hypothetical protein ACI9HB_003090 [Gammaproteobacteria bacterium]|jgi:hypothetical protein